MPVEVITDRAPTYPRVLDQLWAAAWHHIERYANNGSKPTTPELKRLLRPMRGIKTMTGLRVIATGHAFVQNLRRGHYEIATDEPAGRRLALCSPNWPRRSDLKPEQPAAWQTLLSAIATDPAHLRPCQLPQPRHEPLVGPAPRVTAVATGSRFISVSASARESPIAVEYLNRVCCIERSQVIFAGRFT
jgi:hypothetical protein